METINSELIKEITQRLVTEFKPEQVILFGSYAWGTPHPDSDLDLLVIVSHSNLPSTQRASQAYRCLRGIFVPIDVMVKTRAEVERFQDVYASLECEILERGRILYDQSQIRVNQKLVN